MRAKKEPRGGSRLVMLCAAALFLCLTVAITRSEWKNPFADWEALPGLLLQQALEPGSGQEETAQTFSPLSMTALSGWEEESCEETVVEVTEEPVQEVTEKPAQETQPAQPVLPTAGLLEAPEGEAPEGEEEVSLTLSPENYAIEPEDLEIYNNTSIQTIRLADYLGRDLELNLSQDGPQILIMHTHGTEAYTMADGDNYTPSDPARTTDENYNMIRIGEEMKEVFEEMGFSVIHDKTLYDYPSYTSSYARSLEGIKSVLEEYPTISVVLDVHRDAMVDSAGHEIPVTTVLDGEDTAQVMLVVGTEDSGLTHPNWEENLALGAEIQRQLMALQPDFPRALNLRSQRFNQHMTPGSLLVEVGTSGNTLQEAIRGARAFARAAGTVLLEEMEEQ